MFKKRQHWIILAAIVTVATVFAFYFASTAFMNGTRMSTITVVNEQGKPVSGALVQQYSKTDGWLNMGTTDQNGHLQLSEIVGRMVTYQASYSDISANGTSRGFGCTITLPLK